MDESARRTWETYNRAAIAYSRLRLIAAGIRQEPLRLGEAVELNSGGPRCLVVDIEPQDMVTIAWDGGEAHVPQICVHRVA